MDIKRSALIGLILCFYGVVFGCSRSDIVVNDLPEITKWARADVDLAALLTTEPSACLYAGTDITEQQEIILGRIAFRSPYLLGGQAARRGFSCDTCHSNGKINRFFFIQGVSDKPGTADVTNFHFSKTLGDNVFNPKPIPSLTGLAVPKSTDEKTAREKFILRLIEGEFDGTPPPEIIKQSLIAYVAALSKKTCSVQDMSGKAMLAYRLDLLWSMFEYLELPKEAEINDFVRDALRAELGRLYSYYPNSEDIRKRLEVISRDIKAGEIEPAIISKNWAKLVPELNKHYKVSYFNVGFVRERLINIP